MRVLAWCVLGLLLGPASWWAAGAVSGRFEPFDSTLGFLVCQLVLVVSLGCIGLRAGILRALSCLFGVWLGINAFAWLAGDSETRAWIVLLLFSSLTLLMFPLAAALLGGTVRVWRARQSARAVRETGRRSGP
jgi:hypothetical protein